MAFKQVMEMRKKGNNAEAYEMALNDYQQEPENEWTKRALSWCLFDSLKANASVAQKDLFLKKLTEVRDLNLPAEEKMFWNNLTWPINSIVRDCSKMQFLPMDVLLALFDTIKDFPFVKPSKEYSVLLSAFMTLKDKWNKFIEFCDWWDFENFRKEDYEQDTLPNGRRMPCSMAESAYIAYAKHLIAKGDKEAIHSFLPKLQELSDKHPEMQYPNFYIGKLLLALGNTGKETLDVLLPFVRKKQNEFWAWQLLAEALENDEEKYMACLLRAVNCNTKEQFLPNIHFILAKAFKQMHYYADARFHLEKYFEIKVEAQTKISFEARKMSNEKWFAEAVNQKASYNLDYMTITNEIIFSDIQEKYAVVSHVNRDKRIANFIYGKGEEGYLKYDRFLKKLSVGDFVKIRIRDISSERRMNIFSIRLVKDCFETDYLKKVDGVVSTNRSNTAYFVNSDNDSFYIPADLFSQTNVKNGENVKAVVLYSYNKKKDTWGWICIKVFK